MTWRQFETRSGLRQCGFHAEMSQLSSTSAQATGETIGGFVVLSFEITNGRAETWAM
jgi:hypothetical protein